MAFQIALIAAAVGCSLVAGFLFAFAVVVMPGLGTLGDEGFLRAFQATDRVIQDNHPVFLLVWMGSALALVAATALGLGRLDGGERWILIAALLIYVLGVQLPTVAINIPMNNAVQALELDALSAAELESARGEFEPRWNRWNALRAVLACVVSVLLVGLALRL